jgi:uncharacterized protein YbjT (DUF2867 family)
MKIVILGASQGTGAEAVKVALERGHHVTAFARSPEKLALDHAHLTRMRGDFHDRASVEQAIRGQDAVLVTASATRLKAFRENPNYFSQGTAYAIDAMKAHGVRRLVVLSALGTGETRRLMPFLMRGLLVDFLLKVPYADHERQEKMVRESGLDWIVVRPGRLTNGPARRKYVAKVAIEPVPSSISRGDVADCLVSAAESDAWIGEAVQIGG